jgi:ATP-dependent Clp protease protease subunit
MGAFLLAAGTKGKRFILPSARVMIHQPWGGTVGDAKDIEIQANEMKRLKTMLNDKLAKHTGKSLKVIETDTDRDFWMSAAEAQKYGIVDKVLG